MTPEQQALANQAQVASPSYRLASMDQDFLLSEPMRGVRFQLEYEKVESALRAWGVRSTLVVFGSARVGADGAGRHAYWYEEARKFGKLASERGGAIRGEVGQPRDNVIATGGGPGIMQAANQGAFEAGAPSIGFNVTLPHEQFPNPWSTPELTFQFHYFAIRKMHLAMRANALVVFPGGFGTLDELFEILTLRQTGKAPEIPIVLFDRAFWEGVVNFQTLIDHGMVKASDMNLFSFADDAESVWSALLAGGVSPGESIEKPALSHTKLAAKRAK